MNKGYKTNSTKSMKAVCANMELAHCCEPDCQMSIMVDKEDLAEGRALRCVACTMRKKFSSRPPR
jgi:hypothetical protein